MARCWRDAELCYRAAVSARFTLITGAARRDRLKAIGCSDALVGAFENPTGVATNCWVASGEVLAELVGEPYVRDHWMPAGEVVPVCQIDDHEMTYLLLVDGTLIERSEEYSTPVAHGLAGFVTERLAWAWEAGDADDAYNAELAAFANAIGYPAIDALMDGLATTRSQAEHETWLGAFAARIVLE